MAKKILKSIYIKYKFSKAAKMKFSNALETILYMYVKLACIMYNK